MHRVYSASDHVHVAARSSYKSFQYMSSPARDLISRLVRKKPQDRLAMNLVPLHPWILEFDFDWLALPRVRTKRRVPCVLRRVEYELVSAWGSWLVKARVEWNLQGESAVIMWWRFLEKCSIYNWLVQFCGEKQCFLFRKSNRKESAYSSHLLRRENDILWWHRQYSVSTKLVLRRRVNVDHFVREKCCNNPIISWSASKIWRLGNKERRRWKYGIFCCTNTIITTPLRIGHG